LRRTNNPQATAREVDIHAHERRDTGSLNFKDVLGALQRVGFAIECEREFWEVGNFCTIDLILAIPRLGGSNLGVKHLRDIGGEYNEGCTWYEAA
jgi:hypothetical protein